MTNRILVFVNSKQLDRLPATPQQHAQLTTASLGSHETAVKVDAELTAAPCSLRQKKEKTKEREKNVRLAEGRKTIAGGNKSKSENNSFVVFHAFKHVGRFSD